MKVVEVGEGFVRLELTRRNLLSLLAKLDGNPPDSKCTIISPSDRLPIVAVTAVEDAEHYGDRPPGVMVQETEDTLR